MEIDKDLPNIYNLDNYSDLYNNDKIFNLDIVIYFRNNKFSNIYFNEIPIENLDKLETFDIRGILKKYKHTKLNNLYKLSKNCMLTAYFRVKNKSNCIYMYNHGAFSQQVIEDKTFFDCVWCDELNFFINTKSFNDEDYIKIKLCEHYNMTMGRNVKFSSKTFEFNNTDSIVLFKNNRFTEFPIYFEIRYRNLSENDDSFNSTTSTPKKISFPVFFPDGKGEIVCDLFKRYKSGYTCYILKYIFPNGECINIQNLKKCNRCVDYTKLYDITLQSKYKSICYDQILSIALLFKEQYPNNIFQNKFFEIKIEEFNIFKNISSNFTIKLHYKE